MKIFSMIVLIFLLVSCGSKSKEIEEAKQNLLSSQTQSTQEIKDETMSSQEEVNELSETFQNYSRVENILGEGWIELDPVKDIANISESLDISGKVLSPDVTKITVSFENVTSSFPKDENYVLQTYKTGNQSFLYRAYKKYEVLDKGQNLYRIDAYVGDEVKQTLILEVFLADEKIEIPTLGEQIQTSTQNGDLEIYDLTSSGVTCENVGDFLSNKYSWYYWNTCRPVVKDQSFGVNVLRLEGESYLYEKHYFDTVKNIYARVILETGSGITREQLPEQNTLFREKIFPEISGFDNDFTNYNKN